MKRTHPVRVARSRAIVLMAIVWVAAGPGAARAQNVANDFISELKSPRPGRSNGTSWTGWRRPASTSPATCRAWRD